MSQPDQVRSTGHSGNERTPHGYEAVWVTAGARRPLAVPVTPEVAGSSPVAPVSRCARGLFLKSDCNGVFELEREPSTACRLGARPQGTPRLAEVAL